MHEESQPQGNHRAIELEVNAMRTIYKTLEALDPKARSRVLYWIDQALIQPSRLENSQD